MKKFVDKKCRFMQLEVGEWVFVKLRPHRQQTIARRINQKLAPKYYGPFPIIQKIGAVSYKVQLPESTIVHPIFHISQLKKAIGNHVVEYVLPPELGIEEEGMEEPEAVLAVREISMEGTIINQWLMKWKGRTEEETTWEDEVLLQSQFPLFSLEDKAVVAEGGNDRTPNKGHIVTKEHGPVTQQGTIIDGRPKIWNVYTRRKKVGPSGEGVRN